MNTAQSFTGSEHFDADRARVVHDLSALGSVNHAKAQSISTMISRKVKRVWREHREAQERLAILRAPWTHHYAHWVDGPDGPQLHGTRPAPRPSLVPVTPGGWCPCHLHAPQEQVDDGRTS